MAKKETFRIKAAADAPEFVAHGNLEAAKEGGFYATEDPRFAEHLRNNYGAVVKNTATVPKRVRKPKKAAVPVADVPAAASPNAGETNGGSE